MVDTNLIRKSSSSATLLPPKNDDDGNVTELRVVYDYRPHNTNTKQRAYRIPAPNELMVEIEGYPILSTMDIMGAYNNSAVKEKSKCKTALWEGDCLYEYNTAPMGL